MLFLIMISLFSKLQSSIYAYITELPEVMSIRPSRTYKIQTTRSWDYLGLHYNEPKGLLHDSHQGEDIIIGMVDTGIHECYV